MSRLTDLLRAAKQLDPQLGEDLEAEIRPLQERLPFGLNFERHAPEAVELAGHEIRKGSKVRVLPPRGSTARGDQRIWIVDALRDGTAEISTPNGEEIGSSTVSTDDLILVAEFRDRIYPGLRPDGSIERGGDKPFHTVINGENSHGLEQLTFTHEQSIDAIYIDSHPPVDAAVGPAVLIDTDCGYTLEPGGISDEQRSAEVEYSRAHSVPGGSEVLSDDVDAHLVDDHGLQCPQACCRREFRSAGAGSLKCLGPALVAGRADVGADANSQGHRGQADRGMNEFADPGGPDESASTADRAGPVVVGDQAQHGQMPPSVVLPDRGESEFRQGECGIEAGRGKVVHEGPWVVMES